MGARKSRWLHLYTFNPLEMKKCFFLFLSLSWSFAYAQQWEVSFEKSQQKALKENKKVLLVFSGSDWCIPCIRLEDKVWNSATFKTYAEKYLLLYRADFPKRKKNQLPEELNKINQVLASKYNPKGYFPWVVVFSPQGEVKGYFVYEEKTVEKYIEMIELL